MFALKKTKEQSLLIFTFISYAFAIESETSKKPVNVLQLKNSDIGTEKEAILYLGNLEGRYSAACNKQMVIRWNYTTNVTDQTGKLAVRTSFKLKLLK